MNYSYNQNVFQVVHHLKKRVEINIDRFLCSCGSNKLNGPDSMVETELDKNNTTLRMNNILIETHIVCLLTLYEICSIKVVRILN